MKKILITFLLGASFLAANAQNVGLSFSYFIPRNGSFSTPISPFSLRGVGFDLNRYLAVESGFSLYRMAGLNVIDLPFESTDPLTGPNFTLFVPLELVVQFKGKQAQFDIKGGGFAFYGFDQRIDYGNMDRALREYEGWDIANADLSFDNNPGFGYHVGVEFTFYVTNQFGISLECNYLNGTSKFPLVGSYSGGNLNGSNQTVQADYPDAKIDFTGLEFSIGVIFTGR
ncbi:MAG TPA: hypothetical protein P5280_13180 [Cyclobacteriaceae bacterium]|nr:hypothetical protein [Cyclobacteriaceae bacterium]